MRTTRIAVNLLLAAALLAACSDHNALTAPSGRPLAGTAALADRPYTWSLTCNGKGAIGASWYWTQDGAQITSTEQHACYYHGQVSSTGLRPANANGFTAQVGLDPKSETFGSKSWTFDPAGPFNAKLSGSVGSNNDCHDFWCGPPKEDGTLTVDS